MKSKKTKRFTWLKRFMKRSRNSPSRAAIALAKQISQKPLHIHRNYYCPVCKEGGWIMWDDAIPNDMDNFCGICGQRLDWEGINNDIHR